MTRLTLLSAGFCLLLSQFTTAQEGAADAGSAADSVSLSQSVATTLLDIYREALVSDPRLQVASARRDVFVARKDQSKGAMLPQISSAVQNSRNIRESDNPIFGFKERDLYNGERYSLSISQSLYNKSQWEAFRSSQHEAARYAAEYDSREDIVTVDIVSRYSQVLAAEDNLAFVVAEKEATEKQLKQVRARYDRQMAMITELLDVEARRDALLTDEVMARNEVEQAREAVSELIGRVISEPIAGLKDDIFIDWEFDSADGWIERGLSASPHLAAFREGVSAAQARVREAKGQRHPTVGFQISAQKSDIGFENSQANENDTYVASVNLNIPIYSGGQVSARIAEAKANLRVAQQELEEQERLLKKEIRAAFLNARAAKQRVAATRKEVGSAEKSYDARQKGFEYGTVTVVDVLDASENLFRARRDHRQAYYDLMVQAMSLQQTTGDLNTGHVARVERWLAVSAK